MVRVAMLPSPSASRCLVLLLLVGVGVGFLARPVEAVKRPFADIVGDAARRHGVDLDLVHAVIAVESRYRARAQSPADAQGLMQLMPGTQRDLGVSDAFDPRQNTAPPHRRVRDCILRWRLQHRPANAHRSVHRRPPPPAARIHPSPNVNLRFRRLAARPA